MTAKDVLHLASGDRRHEVHYQQQRSGFTVHRDGGEDWVCVPGSSPTGASVLFCNGKRIEGYVRRERDKIHVSYGGETFTFAPVDRSSTGKPIQRTTLLEAPMTGTVTEISCKVGDHAKAGQVLVILSAMKMEHRLCAPQAVRITEVLAQPTKLVDIGQVLVRFEPEGGSEP